MSDQEKQAAPLLEERNNLERMLKHSIVCAIDDLPLNPDVLAWWDRQIRGEAAVTAQMLELDVIARNAVDDELTDKQYEALRWYVERNNRLPYKRK